MTRPTEPLAARVPRALAALDRLGAQPRLRFLSEDQRDFAAIDSAGRVRELVHLAERGELLKDAQAFFHVVLAHDAPATVVSLSPIAAELRDGWSGAGAARQPVTWALRDLGFSPADQEQLFQRVTLQEETQAALESRAGADAETVKVLAAWMFGREQIEKPVLDERVRAIGELAQARRAHQLDAGGLLVTRSNQAPPDPALDGLATEVVRAFDRRHVVVVHGASTQPVAARFLADHVPALLRFDLTALPDAQQARSIAALLAPHAEAIELPLVIVHDDGDPAWTTGLAPIAARPQLELLVCQREADWRGANVEGPDLEVADVAVPGAPVPEIAAADDAGERALTEAFTHSDARVAEAIALQPRSWTGVAGVARALLYRGLVEHAAAERPVIAETVERFGAAWPVVLDTDVASLGGGSSWLESGGLTEQSRDMLASLRKRQRPAAHVFTHLRAFLEKPREVPAPSSASDWRGYADVAFWRRRLQLAPLGFDGAALTAALPRLPLADLAHVVFALSDENGFAAWLPAAREALIARMRDDAGTLEVAEEDGVLYASFLAGNEPAEKLLDRVMERIWLLRQLLPGYETYGARGFGHAPSGEDPARLRVPADRLPPPLLIELNARWLRIAELGLRPADAAEHAAQAVTLRKLALARLSELVKALDTYFRKQKGVGLPGTLIDVEALEATSLRTGRPPLLPRTSVDPWGLGSEASPPAGSEVPPLVRDRRVLALEPLAPYLDAQRRLFAAMTLFLRQSVPVMAIHSLSKSHPPEAVQKVAAQVGFDAEARETSVRALAEALRVLPRYQRELRRHFGDTGEDLSLLERREREAYAGAFVLWERFAHHPGQTLELTHPAEKLDEAEKNAKETLRRHLRKLSKESIGAQILGGDLTWDDEPALWIKFDVRSPALVYSAYLAMHKALQAGLHEVGLSPLLRHALHLQAARVVVVPMVGGKALQASAWVSTPATLAEGDPQLWLKQLNRPARADEWANAGVPTWDDPRLARAERLQSSVRALYDLLAHLADLQRAGALAAGDAVQAHVARRRNEIAPLVARITEDVAGVVEVLHQVPEAERPKRLALLAAVQRLAEFYQGSIASLLPPDGSLPDLAHLAAGAKQLEQGLGETEVFRLLWSADVLGIAVGP